MAVWQKRLDRGSRVRWTGAGGFGCTKGRENNMKISLAGLNKADVLAVLYNASKPQGQVVHYVNTVEAAEDVKVHLGEKTRSEDVGGVHVIHLGLLDAADKLGPAVDEVIRKRRE